MQAKTRRVPLSPYKNRGDKWDRSLRHSSHGNGTSRGQMGTDGYSPLYELSQAQEQVSHSEKKPKGTDQAIFEDTRGQVEEGEKTTSESRQSAPSIHRGSLSRGI